MRTESAIEWLRRQGIDLEKEKTMYYNVCEHCGANLDPGERCDCTELEQKEEERIGRLLIVRDDGQMQLVLDNDEVCIA